MFVNLFCLFLFVLSVYMLLKWYLNNLFTAPIADANACTAAITDRLKVGQHNLAVEVGQRQHDIFAKVVAIDIARQINRSVEIARPIDQLQLQIEIGVVAIIHPLNIRRLRLSKSKARDADMDLAIRTSTIVVLEGRVVIRQLDRVVAMVVTLLRDVESAIDLADLAYVARDRGDILNLDRDVDLLRCLRRREGDALPRVFEARIVALQDLELLDDIRNQKLRLRSVGVTHIDSLGVGVGRVHIVELIRERLAIDRVVIIRLIEVVLSRVVAIHHSAVESRCQRHADLARRLNTLRSRSQCRQLHKTIVDRVEDDIIRLQILEGSTARLAQINLDQEFRVVGVVIAQIVEMAGRKRHHHN